MFVYQGTAWARACCCAPRSGIVRTCTLRQCFFVLFVFCLFSVVLSLLFAGIFCCCFVTNNSHLFLIRFFYYLLFVVVKLVSIPPPPFLATTKTFPLCVFLCFEQQQWLFRVVLPPFLFEQQRKWPKNAPPRIGFFLCPLFFIGDSSDVYFLFCIFLIGQKQWRLVYFTFCFQQQLGHVMFLYWFLLWATAVDFLLWLFCCVLLCFVLCCRRGGRLPTRSARSPTRGTFRTSLYRWSILACYDGSIWQLLW